jgi:hypothetical protein
MSSVAIRSYDAKVDSKKRIILQNVFSNYFHVEEYDDGKILLEPKKDDNSFHISANTLSMMDSGMQNYDKGIVSDPIDFSIYKDI